MDAPTLTTPELKGLDAVPYPNPLFPDDIVKVAPGLYDVVMLSISLDSKSHPSFTMPGEPKLQLTNCASSPVPGIPSYPSTAK